MPDEANQVRQDQAQETGTNVVTVGTIGSKALHDIEINGQETAQAIFERAEISTQDRDLLVNQQPQDWSYVPQPGDYLMAMQHTSAGV